MASSRTLRPRREVRPASTGSRRRGKVLEDAILQATWAELKEAGYAGLTMDGVASRAHTSKPVIYRRWRSRANLVLAAMRNRFGSIASDVPDTGTLRGDVLQLLGRMTQRVRQIPVEVRRGLVAVAPALEREGHPVFELMPGAMASILRHAQERGEIPKGKIPARVMRVPVDLTRHEIILTQGVVPDSVLEEIVDETFLPLVRGRF